MFSSAAAGLSTVGRYIVHHGAVALLEYIPWQAPFSTKISMTRYLNQEEATHIDEELFNECNFSVDQLMELAGLSCASAILDCYPNAKKVLICVGPGNNGGDGLVCARHLKLFGFQPEVFYPKRTGKTLYQNLTKQCELFNIPILVDCPEIEDLNSNYSLIVDALFGFSFKPPVRPEFEKLIGNLIQTITPISSIDIPSGWDVEKGPLDPASCIKPEMLISLTAPKLCSEKFVGKHHYLGGRFIPDKLAEKYDLNLPPYPGGQCFVRLS